jgi:hypothetical protein
MRKKAEALVNPAADKEKAADGTRSISIAKEMPAAMSTKAKKRPDMLRAETDRTKRRHRSRGKTEDLRIKGTPSPNKKSWRVMVVISISSSFFDILAF